MNSLSSVRTWKNQSWLTWPAAVALIMGITVTTPAFSQPAASQPGAAAPHVHGGASGPDAAYNEMMQPMHTMHEAMTSMKSTGSPDKDFIIMMVPHHQAAVDMAKAYLKHGQNEKLRKMAQSIIDSQETEIREMHNELKKLGGAGTPGADTATTTSSAAGHNH